MFRHTQPRTREHRVRTAALSLPHLAACQIAAAVCACASGYDSELEFSDAEARDRVAGVVHDAVQQAVMQYGYMTTSSTRHGGTAR